MVHEQLEQFEQAARTWCIERHPDTPDERHSAFINSATYARFGFTGRYGGPSVREHVAALVIGSSKRLKTDEELFVAVEALIYGELDSRHVEFWSEQSNICFDDDPVDIAELRATCEMTSNRFVTTKVWSRTLHRLQIAADLRKLPMVKLLDELVEQELARLRYE